MKPRRQLCVWPSSKNNGRTIRLPHHLKASFWISSIINSLSETLRAAHIQGQNAVKKQDLIRDPGGGEDLVLCNQIKYSSTAFSFLKNLAKLLRI